MGLDQQGASVTGSEVVECTIAPVPTEKLCPAILERTRPLLEKLITPKHDQTVETSIMDLYRGDTLLWVVGDFDAMLITRMFRRGAKKILSVDLMAGSKLAEWFPEWTKIETHFAKAHGCDKVEFATDRKVRRLMQKLNPDFLGSYVVYSRDVG